MSNRLFIVVPCYNEEEVLPITIPQLTEVIENLVAKEKISSDSGVLFVNDGSSDKTWEIIEKTFLQNKYVYGLNLAGNAGHQNALVAGLETVADMADVMVSIDADLQDDISVIEDMADKYLAGADVVFGVRNDRKTDSFFKRVTAQGFYKFMRMLGVNTVYNHADYRLMSARTVKALLQYKERNLFLRGIVANLGFKTDCVYYARKQRPAGETKYPLKKMITFAWDGITSFSIKPITLVTSIGFLIMMCAAAAFIYTIFSYVLGNTNPGWASIMISIWFLGGLQLFGIGLVGQYVGKVYIETKERPRYHIEKFLKH